MKNWKEIALKPENTVREAMEVINRSAIQLTLVVGDKERLLGTVTDGNIRRALLGGMNLEGAIKDIMNPKPITALVGTSKDEILALMKTCSIRQVPIVNQEGVLVGLELLDSYLSVPYQNNLVVLMAGGMGSRLKPLTDECPKPLLKVAGRPILEWTLNSFIQGGFREFCMIVNYKAEMIEDYFQDGSRWGIKIKYLREEKRMGTAGSLRYLRNLTAPFFVMNGDVLARINYEHMFEHHKQNKNKATLCAQTYDVKLSYGVVETRGSNVGRITEKPTYQYLINSGIYIIDPLALEYLPKEEYVDMPVFLNELIQAKQKVGFFPLEGYWTDIGQKEDLEKAFMEFEPL